MDICLMLNKRYDLYHFFQSHNEFELIRNQHAYLLSKKLMVSKIELLIAFTILISKNFKNVKSMQTFLLRVCSNSNAFCRMYVSSIIVHNKNMQWCTLQCKFIY